MVISSNFGINFEHISSQAIFPMWSLEASEPMSLIAGRTSISRIKHQHQQSPFNYALYILHDKIVKNY